MVRDFMSKLPDGWEVLFKVALAGFPIVMTLLGSFSLWVTIRSFDQEKSITTMQSEIDDLKSFKSEVEKFVNQGPRYTREEAVQDHTEVIKSLNDLRTENITAIGKIHNDIAVIGGKVEYLVKEVERLRNEKP